MKRIQIFGRIFIVIFIICILGALVYFMFFHKASQNEIMLYGNIEIREVNLSFRVSGRLNALYFEEGDYVKAGDVLAKLDFDTFETNLAELKAKTADLRAKKINADDIYKRNMILCADNTLSKQECKNLLTDKTRADAEYELSLAQLDNAKIALDDATLRAPNDGIILTRIMEKGTILPVGAPVYSMSLFKPLWARAYIKEEDLGKIKLGQKAYISSDSMPDKEFLAHIGFISPVAEFTPKTVETVSLRTDLVYRLRVIVDEDDEELNLYLRQGMPVNIKIPLDVPSDKGGKQ